MKNMASLIVCLAALAACDSRTVGPDEHKVVLQSKPALVTSERHTGAFAAGAALSMDAALKPLDPAPVKEIRLDTTHKIIEIAPGVKFSAWTFGDQVPGPACARASATASSSR